MLIMNADVEDSGHMINNDGVLGVVGLQVPRS
jgi:hypothetical protein